MPGVWCAVRRRGVVAVGDHGVEDAGGHRGAQVDVDEDALLLVDGQTQLVGVATLLGLVALVGAGGRGKLHVDRRR